MPPLPTLPVLYPPPRLTVHQKKALRKDLRDWDPKTLCFVSRDWDPKTLCFCFKGLGPKDPVLLVTNLALPGPRGEWATVGAVFDAVHRARTTPNRPWSVGAESLATTWWRFTLQPLLNASSAQQELPFDVDRGVSLTPRHEHVVWSWPRSHGNFSIEFHVEDSLRVR